MSVRNGWKADISADSFVSVDHRAFTRRFLASLENQMKVSFIGMAVILAVIIVTNLIW